MINYELEQEAKRVHQEALREERKSKKWDKRIAEIKERLSKEDESKEWIHREQQGKVRGVQRLGFKPVCKKKGYW